MSDNAESTTSQTKNESESSTSLFGCVTSSTPTRLFGQFRQNSSGFSQNLSKEENSPSSKSYFASAVSALSTNSSGGFGTGSTSLAASLAPLTSNKELFGSSLRSNEENPTKEEAPEEENPRDDDEESSSDENGDKNPSNSSLLEKAAEYEARRASNHPSAMIQGDTSTGEEEETTSFQMAGKLFMYSSDQQQYVERGYGVLKINEKHDSSEGDRLQSRLLMRLDKSFRVILNSPIFPNMTVEKATDRSVRFGAQDESHLRIFVIKASTNDCANFFKTLKAKIQLIEQQSPEKSVPNSSPTTTRIRKRSHSKSDSETGDNNVDNSKKSKILEEKVTIEEKRTSEDDSNDSSKTGEQESNS